MPAELLSTLGPAGLLAVAVGLVLLGRLIPSRTLERIVSDKDRQIADWRAAAQLEQERGRIQAAQVSELLELAHTTNALISGLAVAAGRRAEDAA